MITILHNPRCSKSREALRILSEGKRNYTLRAYIKNPLDYDDLVDLQKKLGLKAIEFTRTKEPEFKQNNLTKDSSDEDILKAMAKFPKLMERAIVYNENNAILCRPPENVLKLKK